MPHKSLIKVPLPDGLPRNYARPDVHDGIGCFKIPFWNTKTKEWGFTYISTEDADQAKFNWVMSDGKYVNRSATAAEKGPGFTYITKYLYLHLLIVGRKNGLIVDHIDDNKINNMRHNLRHITFQLNVQRRKKHKANKTGVGGVNLCVATGMYHAAIYVNNKKKFLGSFHNIDAAAAARREAELKYFGENCLLG